jgi:hypothetical protein
MGIVHRKQIFTLILSTFCLFLLFGGEKKEVKKVLLLGDSHAYALKNILTEEKNRGNVTIEVKGISSSGLARRDFFDWLAFASSEESNGYDLYVVILGTNDGQNSHGREDERFGTLDWEYLYTARVEDFIASLQRKGNVLWVSIPVIKEENLGRKTEYIQALIDEVCHFHNVNQLDITPYITGEMRRADGIHFNNKGITTVSGIIKEKVDELFPY